MGDGSGTERGAGGLSRRQVLGGISLLPLAGALPWLLEDARADAATGARYRFFTAHEAAVVDDATARLIPGPEDDPSEAGHPGAREADVVRYIDTMLSVFTVRPARVHAGGPWSNRHSRGPDYFARFIPLDAAQLYSWERRVAHLQEHYRAGIRQLDAAAHGDFTSVSPTKQDRILASSAVADFMGLLFTHAIEGMYSNPEYGGNRGLVGWQDIKFPGDSQPVGYTPEEVERYDGFDPVDQKGVVGQLLNLFGAFAEERVDRRRDGS